MVRVPPGALHCLDLDPMTRLQNLGGIAKVPVWHPEK